jgi:hypothetical protein
LRQFAPTDDRAEWTNEQWLRNQLLMANEEVAQLREALDHAYNVGLQAGVRRTK